MPLHEIKTCPRCDNIFECKAGDINHCQCSCIELTVEERCFIEECYADCLYASCLIQLKNRYTFFKEKYLFNER